MLIKNASILLGEDLDFVDNVTMRIQNQRFKNIQKNIVSNTNEVVIDCEGLMIIPGFVNCHTHVGDSIGKDVAIDNSVNKKIHPVFGAKAKILSNTDAKLLGNFITHSCTSMLHKGITTFVDFREGGLEGVLLLKNILKKIPIRCVVLGRLNYYQNPAEIQRNVSLPKIRHIKLKELIQNCDGLGISGANENSTSVLRHYSKTAKIRAIHSCETEQSILTSKKMTNKSEAIRALSLKPHFLVHMTHASLSELCAAAKKTRGIVICPRANAALAEGIPDVERMKKSGCTVALGTDNIMINSPDMFREMDYLWKVTMGLHKKRINPKEILKMATVNGGKLLKKDIGIIKSGKLADCIFIDKHSLDLEPMHNPYAAIVHRASQSTIRAVMIGGKIVHGKI